MKKKVKVSLTITVGIVCFILTLVIFMQFKVVNETDITSIETMREEELQEELANWKAKYEETEEQYNEIIETLNSYQEESSSDSETKETLEAELENLKLMLGTTDVEGEGIIITLADTDDAEKTIDADEIMIIVNYLKNAGAEAISINDQRVVSTTYFAYINSSFIQINGERVTSPYTIKAIGDPDYLKSSLVGTGGYAEKIETWGQEIEIEEKKNITISKYDGELETKYIEDED